MKCDGVQFSLQFAFVYFPNQPFGYKDIREAPDASGSNLGFSSPQSNSLLNAPLRFENQYFKISTE